MEETTHVSDTVCEWIVLETPASQCQRGSTLNKDGQKLALRAVLPWVASSTSVVLVIIGTRHYFWALCVLGRRNAPVNPGCVGCGASDWHKTTFFPPPFA
jgi:hypothetical protein